MKNFNSNAIMAGFQKRGADIANAIEAGKKVVEVTKVERKLSNLETCPTKPLKVIKRRKKNKDENKALLVGKAAHKAFLNRQTNTAPRAEQFGKIKRVALIQDKFVPEASIIKSELESYMDQVALDDRVSTVSFTDINGGSTVEERDMNDKIIRTLFLSDKKRLK